MVRSKVCCGGEPGVEGVFSLVLLMDSQSQLFSRSLIAEPSHFPKGFNSLPSKSLEEIIEKAKA